MTHPHGAPAKTGILLINLGTPEAPTAKALLSYLKEFLPDPRVVKIPRTWETSETSGIDHVFRRSPPLSH